MTNKELIVYLPKWIGDSIMALPAIDYLRKSGIKLTLIGKPWIKKLLEDMEDVELITLPTTKIKFIPVLKAIPVKNMLILTNSVFPAVAGKLTNKKTFGFSNLAGKAICGIKNTAIQKHARRLILTKGISKPQNIKHETDLFYFLAKQCLETWFPSLDHTKYYQMPLIPKLPISIEALKQARNLLNELNINQPYIVLCPFAHGLSNNGQSKKWPEWKRLLQTINHFPCIICPGPNELKLAYEDFPNALILENIALNVYAAILSLSKTVIANDSGPMHIAAAVGANTLSLFGTTDPNRVAPNNSKVLGGLNRWPTLEDVLFELAHHDFNIKL